MKWLTILCLFLASSIAMASVPLAPRMGAGGKIDMFGCMQSNDFYIANFAAYPFYAMQQQGKNKTPIMPYCQDFPFTGDTQIMLDLLDRDVRRKSVWIKIFDNHKSLIAETTPAVQKQAVITTRVNFPHQGQYDVVLYVEDNDLNVNPETSALHIPLMVAMTVVGEPASTGNFLTVTLVIIIFALGLGWLVTRQLKPKKLTV
jgi:hypothetical protein